MCALLSSEDFQKAERLALANADASLLTVAQACALLDIRPSPDATPGLPCSTASRAVQDAEVEVMNLQAGDAALRPTKSDVALFFAPKPGATKRSRWKIT